MPWEKTGVSRDFQPQFCTPLHRSITPGLLIVWTAEAQVVVAGREEDTGGGRPPDFCLKPRRSIDIAFERIVVEKLAAPQIAAIDLAQFGFIANGTPQSADRRDLVLDQTPGIPVAQQEIRR